VLPSARRSRVEPVASVASSKSSGLLGEPKRQPFEVGFGGNTLSAQGAALQTVSRNLESARSLVPTVEELRAAAQQRRAEERAAARRDSQAPSPAVGFPRQSESVLPKAQPQVKNLFGPEQRALGLSPARSSNDSLPVLGFGSGSDTDANAEFSLVSTSRGTVAQRVSGTRLDLFA